MGGGEIAQGKVVPRGTGGRGIDCVQVIMISNLMCRYMFQNLHTFRIFFDLRTPS